MQSTPCSVDYTTALPYEKRMQTVVETEEYLRDARRAGLSEEERELLVDFFAEHPDAGDPIPGTGGARKMRIAAKGRGKRGGGRVISFYTGPDIPVFLLNLFAKNEKIDLTRKERNELKEVLATLAQSYRTRSR